MSSQPLIVPRPRIEHACALSAGVLIGVTGFAVSPEPIGRAFWGLMGVVLLLPFMMPTTPAPHAARPAAYSLASGVVVLSVWISSGWGSALIAASVAFSLAGMVLLLAALRVPATLAIGLLILQSVVFLTWPAWAAALLIRFDSQRLIDLLVKVGPLFAINGYLDPTDPFTHRPLAYRLTNLGQDVFYEMPRSVWPCVIVHVLAGLPGALWAGVRRRPRSETAGARPTSTSVGID